MRVVNTILEQTQLMYLQIYHNEVPPKDLEGKIGISEYAAGKTLRTYTDRLEKLKVDNTTKIFMNRKNRTGITMLPGREWNGPFFSETKYIYGNNCYQMFCKPPMFVNIYPMKTKG